MKYLINCKFCGVLLMKTTQPLVAVLESEIKCLGCKRIVRLPEEVNVVVEKQKTEHKNKILT